MDQLLTTRLHIGKIEPRRNTYSIAGLCPYGKDSWTFLVSETAIKKATRVSKGAVHECENIPIVLTSPDSLVYQGIRNDELEEGLVYAGLPNYRYSENGDRKSPKEGQYFLIFINEDRVIYNWGWELLAGNGLRLEDALKSRFDRRIR